MASNYAKYESIDNQTSTRTQKRDPQLTVDTYATIRFTFDRVFGNSNSYGQSVATKLTDVKLVNGVLMRNIDNPEKFKVFSWRTLPIIVDEPTTAADAPEIHTANYDRTYK